MSSPVFFHEDIASFKPLIPAGAKLMALDIGKTNIGLAIGNTEIKIATPLENYKRHKKFTQCADYIANIIALENIDALICGVPYSANGSENQQSQSTKQFVRNFNKLQQIPIFLVNEESTSTAAHLQLSETTNLNYTKRKKILDCIAAQIILERFFLLI